MKKTDWKIFIAAIVYTLLFYKQESGLNFLIFSILITALSFIQYPENIKKPAWLAVAAGTLISGFMVFKLGTNLPILANVISLIFLAGLSFKPNTSLLLSALNSLSSLILAIPLLVINFFKKNENETPEQKSKKTLFKKMILLLFPLFVVFVFFVLYRDSNPLFLKITEDINLDWLSFPLVKHFLVGLFVLYAFFVQRIITRLNNFDENKTDDIDLVDEEKHQQGFFARFISLESETYTAMSLLIMLNVLIAFLNAIDINYLWLKAALPQGLVFSDYLHSGTFTLILSILLAIVIIVFFFRGIFNFNAKGKWLKILGFVWVLQNIIMIVSAMLRNQLYIADYGMTHKRIGVYVFLALAIVGLLVTFVKIAAKKNTWFLFRKNAWAFYGVLIIATFFNWDNIITDYNISLANKQYVVDLDKDYLARLSHVNTAFLALQESDTTPFEIYENVSNSYYGFSALQTKIQKLLDYENRSNWQETCLNKNENIVKLKALNEMGKIAKLDLYSLYINDIPHYETLSNIKGLNANNNNLENNIDALAFYKKLEVLNLAGNNITTLDSLPKLEFLTHLNLEDNAILSFQNLKNTPNLKHLNISNPNFYFDEMMGFPILENLESIKLSKTRYDSWAFLENQENLKEIIFLDTKVERIEIPNLKALTKVNLKGSTNLNTGTNFLDSLSHCENITALNLSKTALNSTLNLVDNKSKLPLFKKLEKLEASHNNLHNDIKELAAYKTLKYLDISNNNIVEAPALKALVNLEELNISGNKLKNFENISGFVKLNTLYASDVKMEKIDELLALTKLQKLILTDNRIENIDNVSSLKNLETLNLSSNRIENIEALIQLKKLTNLTLDNNPIQDYSFLFQMTQLEYLSVGALDLAFIEELKEKLPNTEINYYSTNLNKEINYNNNKRASYKTEF